jgi:hypothetical protein
MLVENKFTKSSKVGSTNKTFMQSRGPGADTTVGSPSKFKMSSGAGGN